MASAVLVQVQSRAPEFRANLVAELVVYGAVAEWSNATVCKTVFITSSNLVGTSICYNEDVAL